MLAVKLSGEQRSPDPGRWLGSRHLSVLPRQVPLVEFLRGMVLQSPAHAERFHVVYLDGQRSYLGDAPLGQGSVGALSLRMRSVFSRALSLGASSLVVAHNHPSGLCRPSEKDIVATRRLNDIASALDIELVDHLIFTRTAVYSMRAGGDL